MESPINEPAIQPNARFSIGEPFLIILLVIIIASSLLGTLEYPRIFRAISLQIYLIY